MEDLFPISIRPLPTFGVSRVFPAIQQRPLFPPPFHVAGKKSECRRCKEDMPKGTRCVRVTKPGKMGLGAAYCTDCFSEVLDETERKLDELRSGLC